MGFVATHWVKSLLPLFPTFFYAGKSHDHGFSGIFVDLAILCDHFGMVKT